jgi:hypothetical protein
MKYRYVGGKYMYFLTANTPDSISYRLDEGEAALTVHHELNAPD